jgi:hypothetical protein
MIERTLWVGVGVAVGWTLARRQAQLTNRLIALEERMDGVARMARTRMERDLDWWIGDVPEGGHWHGVQTPEGLRAGYAR